MTRFCMLSFTLALALAGCKPDNAPVQLPLVRTVVVDLQPIAEARHGIGEIKPRYQSDLSFRVAGKLLTRSVDVGASVRKGDTLARLDTPDYQNRLRSAEAELGAADAELVEAQGAEARQAKLLKDGWTPRASYDTALRNLRAAEGKMIAAKANRDLIRDQLSYTELKADFDGVVTAVGAEGGQNVSAGQMVVRLAQPDDKDAVFNVAETVFAGFSGSDRQVIVWALSNPELTVEGTVREISPVADPVTRTYAVKVTLKDPPPQLRFGMTIGGRLKSDPVLAVALPLVALFEKGGAPAVWVFDRQSGSVSLRKVTIARYEANTVIVAGGLAKGDIVVTAGVNTLTVGQKVLLASDLSAPERGQ